jgi:hypothetical protein
MKVFGVEGERLEGADPSSTTQDFFFNNTPMIALTDIDTCLDVMQMREKYFDSPMKLSAATKLRKNALNQNAPFMLPNTNIISHEFFTQSAFRFDKWLGRMELSPVDDKMKENAQKVKSNDEREVLREWLKAYFGSDGAKYEFKVYSEEVITDCNNLGNIGNRSSLVQLQIIIPLKTVR